MVGEEENCHYNVQLVSVIYNNELKEHLDELGELKNTLAEDGKAYSDTTRWNYTIKRGTLMVDSEKD